MSDPEIERLKQLVRDTFVTARRPPPGSLHESEQSDESSTVLEAAFADKTSWHDLDGDFLNDAPRGWSSALSFFSDAGFRYFLPAYLIADLDGYLYEANPTFHLTYTHTDTALAAEAAQDKRATRQNAWIRVRHDQFSPSEASVIVAYLEYKAALDDCDREEIHQAIINYWQDRAAR